MKNNLQRVYYIFPLLISLWIMIASSSVQAQYYPFSPLYYNTYFSPFTYFLSPFFLPLPFSLNSTTEFARIANVPLTSTSSLFPAPVLPNVPLATTGGVGVSSLIPTAQVTVTLPINSLVATPLSPLITYTPLSLVGLTYAPVPTTAPLTPAPIIIPTLPSPPPITTITISPATSAAFLSLITNALSGLII